MQLRQFDIQATQVLVPVKYFPVAQLRQRVAEVQVRQLAATHITATVLVPSS